MTDPRDNTAHARYGRCAIARGTPDAGMNGPNPEGIETDAADTVANVLHQVHRNGGDTERVIENALLHFRAEIAEPTPSSTPQREEQP